MRHVAKSGAWCGVWADADATTSAKATTEILRFAQNDSSLPILGFAQNDFTLYFREVRSRKTGRVNVRLRLPVPRITKAGAGRVH